METPRRIQFLRKRAGLSQTQLAERLGVARSTVCRYEAGTRRPPVEAIARALDMTPAEFYSAAVSSRAA